MQIPLKIIRQRNTGLPPGIVLAVTGKENVSQITARSEDDGSSIFVHRTKDVVDRDRSGCSSAIYQRTRPAVAGRAALIEGLPDMFQITVPAFGEYLQMMVFSGEMPGDRKSGRGIVVWNFGRSGSRQT